MFRMEITGKPGKAAGRRLSVGLLPLLPLLPLLLAGCLSGGSDSRKDGMAIGF